MRKTNPELAAYWFRKASDEIPEAMYNYGYCLEYGLGVDRDPVAAAECYRKAAEKKCRPAEFKYAMALIYGVDYQSAEEKDRFKEEDIPASNQEKGRKIIQSLADAGYLPAQVELASILVSTPNDVSAKDAGEVFRLVSEAVKNQDAPARAWRVLGDCYFLGLGTAPDDRKAIEALNIAVEKGSLEAMSRLGYCYEKGIGCNVDLEKALVLYQVAANNGIVEARRRLNQ